MEVDTINNECGPDLAKALYSAPRLMLYGDVSQLTAAGSGTPAETDAPGQGTFCMAPDRKPSNFCA